jgi:hypothetical protein
MGILDEAIREHLDLKRRRGADAGELEQLENEAFGPPTRPGEPDFPDRSEEGVEGVAEEPFDGATAETTFMPAEEAVGPEAEGSEAEAPAVEASVVPPEAELAEGEPAEGELAEAELAEGEPAATFFDQEVDSEMELGDLELQLDEPPGPEPEAPLAEPPIESLETEEHQVDELLEEEPPGEPVVEGEEPEAPLDAEPAEEEGEEGDVLEKTPEFLRDQPEDDELWFEQGEPKDFDF